MAGILNDHDFNDWVLLSCTVLCSCRHKEMMEGEERVKIMQIQLVDLKPLPDSTTAATEVQQLQQQYPTITT